LADGSTDARGLAMSENRGLWSWSEERWEDERERFDGWDVEAQDGELGSVAEARYENGGAYLVVNTGTWIFGEKVLLPAGLVDRVDPDAKQLHVDVTRDQVEKAPPFDAEGYREQDYREAISYHYYPAYGGVEAPTEQPR
jgi:hypothetical protein